MRVMTCVAGLLLACSVFGGNKDPKTDPAPAYNRASESKFFGSIAEVREVGKDHALPGIFLTVAVKSDKLTVYVGPKEFVKLFDLTFSEGQEVDVLASKVKYEGGEVFLAREIRMGTTTLILRDDSGWPNWDWNKPPIPTGF